MYRCSEKMTNFCQLIRPNIGHRYLDIYFKYRYIVKFINIDISPRYIHIGRITNENADENHIVEEYLDNKH